MADKNDKSRESQVEAENKKNAEAEAKAGNVRDDEPVHPSLDNMPERAEYVGLLEYEVNPDAGEEALVQQQENFPRAPKDAFRPEEHEVEEARGGYSATARSLPGCREVIVENDVIHDGEVIKAGVQPLPVDIADALIADNNAWEPVGKKRGR
jgi:hypothetical protein